MERIYLDHAATTPLRQEVLEAMLPYFGQHFGNASSVHSRGEAARQVVDAAREQVAALLNCRPPEIIFTSGGTESDNLALRGVMLASPPAKRHLVTTTIEHPAVLETAADLRERYGCEVTYVPVDGHARVDPAELEHAMTDHTALVSVMLANNEVGTIQPVPEIASKARARGIRVHTDAVQAAGQLSLDVQSLGVDLLTLSAHKFGGPLGVGLLYARRSLKLTPQTTGGGQQRGRRGGTLNLPGVAGLATAMTLAERERESEAQRRIGLRQLLIEETLQVEGAILTGHPGERLPNSASFCFEGVNGETILLELDQRGIEASSGSACASGSTDPSHVLVAMGISSEVARTAVRFTLGRDTTEQQVRYTARTLKEVIERLRSAYR